MFTKLIPPVVKASWFSPPVSLPPSSPLRPPLIMRPLYLEKKTSLPTSSALATIDLLLAFEKELRKRWLAGAGNNFCTNMLHSRHLSFKAENSLKIVKLPPRHVALHLDHLLHGVLGKENDQGEASDPAGFP